MTTKKRLAPIWSGESEGNHMHSFSFQALVPLVLNEVMLAEEVECTCTAVYEAHSDTASITEISIGIHGKMTLTAKSDDAIERAMWLGLSRDIYQCADYDDALARFLDDNDLRLDPFAEHRLGAFELGVGRYA